VGGAELPSRMTLPPADIAGRLVAWYRAGSRDLPWRSDPTPYRVLLSELMCQQTRIDTALPYFHRFVERWPTLADLAAANEAEVLHAWAGLGYYSRARNLLRAAKEATAMGGLPRTVDGLRALPGIGPYTAGAIASIAFGVRTGLVDGNVERVLSRLDAREADPRSTAGRKALWARAEELHGQWPGHPGDLNQALMELGALVCTPRAPDCPSCVLAEGCEGRAAGIAESLPRKAPKRPPRAVFGAAAIVRWEGQLLLGRRSPDGLLAGLWEPLRVAVEAGEDPIPSMRRLLHEATGTDPAVLDELGSVVHVFSHRRLTCRVFEARLAGRPHLQPAGDYDEVRWMHEPGAVALSSLARKLLAEEAQPGLPLAAEPRPR
jgi:A/G-specific adenine glycosylase